MTGRPPRPSGRAARRAPRAPWRERPEAFALVAAAGGLATAIGSALPWYVADIAGPFTAGTASGVASGVDGKLVLALAILLTLAGAALIADLRGLFPLDRGVAAALTLVAGGCAAVCAGLVAYRLLAPPPDLNSRDYGLYLTAAGAFAALVAIARQVLRR